MRERPPTSRPKPRLAALPCISAFRPRSSANASRSIPSGSSARSTPICINCVSSASMPMTASQAPSRSKNGPRAGAFSRRARRGEFNQLLIYKLDRLGRDTRLILNAVAELEKHGVRVRSMTEEFDTATATGRLMLTMLSGFAAHERDMIRERSMAGTDRLARAGAWLGGIVPFGYRKEGEDNEARLVISEDEIPGVGISEAEVVRQIFAWPRTSAPPASASPIS